MAPADTRICVARMPCVLQRRTNEIGSCALRGVDESGGELKWGIHVRPGRKRRITVWYMPMKMKAAREKFRGPAQIKTGTSEHARQLTEGRL